MGLFKRRNKAAREGQGLVLVESVPEAIAIERVLKQEGYEVRLVAPPPALRRGCDLAVGISLVERVGIERVLRERGTPYVELVPQVEGAAPLLNMVMTVDFGNALMVKAGNMKISFDKSTGIIVNTSGGGCPDIPYLHSELIGRHLTEAARPKDVGFTLCALMADRAFEECLKIWEEARRCC